MRFIFRSFTGLFLLAATLALLVLAAGQIFNALQAAKGNLPRERPVRERTYAAPVVRLTPQTITPLITAYGDVSSANSFEIRATSAGALVQLSPAFRDGGYIEAGALMLQIDPSRAVTALALAEIDLADAQTDLGDAQSALPLAMAELTATQDQLSLRQQALARQQSLENSGVGTGASVETAALAVAASKLALLKQQKTIAQAETRILRAEITMQRREILVSDAHVQLNETKVFAPFDGILSNVAVTLQRRVSNNERLGVLLDPLKLDIAARISNAQFTRLLDASGALVPARVRVLFEAEGHGLEISGVLDRASAEVGAGQTGRLVYIGVDTAGAGILRPGDFVTLSIEEPPLENVAIMPATALNADSQILVLGEGDVLQETTVNVLRYQGDDVIVAAAPFGQEYILVRAPQIGAGIRITPLREDAVTPASPMRPLAETTDNMVPLSAAQRAEFIALVEANRRMPAEARQRALNQLQQEEVPARLIVRLQAGGRG